MQRPHFFLGSIYSFDKIANISINYNWNCNNGIWTVFFSIFEKFFVFPPWEISFTILIYLFWVFKSLLVLKVLFGLYISRFGSQVPAGAIPLVRKTIANFMEDWCYVNRGLHGII